jgi:hypothetical protein
MIVDKVRNATTANSAVHYELTLRIWPDDLGGVHAAEELLKLVTKAVNGISEYEYGQKR